MGADRSRLLASAREWFERDDQIGQYASQAAGGVSDLEAGLLQRLPEPPADVWMLAAARAGSPFHWRCGAIK